MLVQCTDAQYIGNIQETHAQDADAQCIANTQTIHVQYTD